MTFEHNSSDLAPQGQNGVCCNNNFQGPVPHSLNDVDRSKHMPRSLGNDVCYQFSSGLVLHQNDSDHNRSENSVFKSTRTKRSRFKAVPKDITLAVQDSYITTRVGITIPPSHSNAEDK
ncbi:hypothetical protein Tco_0673197, partial [Tanacetum coccineum]